jgi:hypothetical protein
MEIELLSMQPPCYPQFGFAGASFALYQGHQGVGDDAISWAVDGERGLCWHAGKQALAGPKWKRGDVIGLAVNLEAGTLHVSVNGEYPEGGPAFAGGVKLGEEEGEWLFPALSGRDMRVRCNFGQDGFRHAPPPPPPLFPGEIGDIFSDTAVVLLLTAATPSAVQMAAAKMNDEKLTVLLLKAPSAVLATRVADGGPPSRSVVLASDEERTRGVQVLPQRACLEWDARSGNMLAHAAKTATFDSMITDAEKRHADAGTAVVGVVLPMARARAQERLAGVLAAVAELVGLPDLGNGGDWGGGGVRVVRVLGRTTTYCAVPSVAELKKRLGELSNAALRCAARDHWGVKDTAGCDSETLSRAAVEAVVVDAFVQQELQAELAAALRCSFASTNASDLARLDTALDDLLQDWASTLPPAPPSLTPAAKREHRISAAAAGLNSVARWEAVARWVGLFRVRTQGRSRAGIKRLMAEKERWIGQAKLTEGEVLALYLYTGPEYMLINGILRSFPLSMLDLLEGNTLCTTLFCISSALKKVARGTELPNSAKVFRGLGRMLLPLQFWVPHGTPAWSGGVERAFMSTTADKDVALFYANGRGTVVEISVGRIQIGGDISAISMVGLLAPGYHSLGRWPRIDKRVPHEHSIAYLGRRGWGARCAFRSQSR